MKKYLVLFLLAMVTFTGFSSFSQAPSGVKFDMRALTNEQWAQYNSLRTILLFNPEAKAELESLFVPPAPPGYPEGPIFQPTVAQLSEKQLSSDQRDVLNHLRAVLSAMPDQEFVKDLNALISPEP